MGEFMDFVTSQLDGMPEEDRATLLSLAQEIDGYEEGLEEGEGD